MNQVFDFNRFVLLVSKHWSENRRKYLLGMGAIAGLLFFWYSFLLLVEQNSSIAVDIQAATYFVGLAFGGCLYGSVLFNELSSGPKAMNYLSFPASHLEKLLCGLLYGVVFFFLTYTVIFYLVDFAMVTVGNSIAADQGNPGPVVNAAKVVNVFESKEKGLVASDEPPNPLRIFLLSYIAIQSAYILGSIYFAKFSFIKTTIALACLALIITFFLAKVLEPIMPDPGGYSGLTSYRVYTDSTYGTMKEVALPGWINDLLTTILKYAFAPLLWLVTYFRFKEKEV